MARRKEVERLRIKDKAEITRELSELSVLERNPLLYPPYFESEEAMKALSYVINRLVEDLGGESVKIETMMVLNYGNGRQYPRFVAKFEPKQVTDKQLGELQEIAKRMYPTKVTSLANSNGSKPGSILFPKLSSAGVDRDESTIGWYFGADSGRPGSFHNGLFVFRHIGKRDVASGVKARRDASWFTQKDLLDNSGKKAPSNYVIEIRESTMFQTDLAEAVIATSLVLAGKELPAEKPGLTYEIYHYMNRMGLKSEIEIGGLESQVAEIDEALFAPLANQRLARGLAAVPRSVTLIGQVGTGKTQIIRYLMNQDRGVMMVNVDPTDLEVDMQQPEDRKIILPRITSVAEKTGRSIVLVIEDIERLARADNPMSAKLLNELAGLFKNRFFILCSTNHPEEFNPQLLEAERLGGRLIHCPLPAETARRSILEAHTPVTSGELGLELFDPQLLGLETGTDLTTAAQARGYILDGLAEVTAGFTHRYLQDLCNRAKVAFINRVGVEVGRMDGLTEADLVGKSFSLADWNRALAEVLEVYNVKERLEEDERLRKLVHPGSNDKRGMGFKVNGTNGHVRNIFERRRLVR